ncbi:MAG: amidohydrolase family protein [Bacteroidetes bacterium]|jgi:hypothetical protein|nr:amidohydrolase family protein [Bacteroidota bacterium]
MDAHAHLVGFPSGPPGPPFGLIANGLRLFVCNGITSVRDAGNALESIQFAQRWSAEHGGPHVAPTSPLLDEPPLLWGFSRVIDTPDTARREVERLHAEGATWTSLYHNVRPSTAQAATAAARERSMKIAANTQRMSAEDLVDLRPTSIEHAHLLLCDDDGVPETVTARMRRWASIDLASPRIDQLVHQLRETDVTVCSTLLYAERWCSIDAIIDEPNLEYMTTIMPFAEQLLRMRTPMGMMMGKRSIRDNLGIPSLTASERDEVEDGLETLRAFVAHLYASGVRVVAGTGTPSPSIVPGFSLHQELERLVESGLSSAQALSCATSHAAALLGADEDVGVVREGARADLLLIDGNPQQDISRTRNVLNVYKRGSAVDRHTLFEPIQTTVQAL